MPIGVKHLGHNMRRCAQSKLITKLHNTVFGVMGPIPKPLFKFCFIAPFLVSKIAKLTSQCIQ